MYLLNGSTKIAVFSLTSIELSQVDTGFSFRLLNTISRSVLTGIVCNLLHHIFGSQSGVWWWRECYCILVCCPSMDFSRWQWWFLSHQCLISKVFFRVPQDIVEPFHFLEVEKSELNSVWELCVYSFSWRQPAHFSISSKSCLMYPLRTKSVLISISIICVSSVTDRLTYLVGVEDNKTVFKLLQRLQLSIFSRNSK